MLHVSVSAYKQAGAERKSDPICRKVGGGGTCMRPGRGCNNGRVYDLLNRVYVPFITPQVVNIETNTSTSAFPCELLCSIRAVHGEARELDG